LHVQLTGEPLPESESEWSGQLRHLSRCCMPARFTDSGGSGPCCLDCQGGGKICGRSGMGLYPASDR
jgi:hypothetical protein